MRLIQISTSTILTPDGSREVVYGLDVTGKVHYGRWSIADDGKGNKVNVFTWDGVLPSIR
jgi:hypothetical protein